MKARFDHETISKKWQDVWDKEGLYSPNVLTAKNPFYNLYMFPYPSAEGLHAGHAFSSTGSDVFGRFMRMNGKTVFQPMGYDSFGIHSENYAMKVGQTPQVMLSRTTKHFEEQLRSLGHGYDWTRTVTTSNEDYYKWTQWLFTVCFREGLAYRKEARVNWCPSCKTVLSDEQVIDGKCERCGTVVEHKNLTQWFLSITKHADRLLDNLDHIDWPARIKQAQKQWIGRKTGVEIRYQIKDSDQSVTCFTTRPETNFGATFVVVSPEYAQKNLVSLVSKENISAVNDYIESSLHKTEQERIVEEKTKTGVFTGLYAVNNLNGEEMPIWVSDFVLSGFGTGAVVGVPGHDTRDFAFASTFNLPVIRVVLGPDNASGPIESESQVYEGEGTMVNSDFLDGKGSSEAMKEITTFMSSKGYGQAKTSFHLRDWLISRQRYWGAPIPMIFCASCRENGRGEIVSSDWDATGWYSVPQELLPVTLPPVEDYKPKGEGKGPLADHPEFFNTVCPACGNSATRETDVMDTFMDSSWYFLRYPSVLMPNSNEVAFDPEVTAKWLPVNLYFGGAEHAVLHLLYARFMNQVLFDQKKVSFEEPFPRFFAHGLMIKDGAKMSKSRGNVVNPDEYIKKFGADALRLYVMFLGPMDGSPDFRDSGIEGMERFVNRVWDVFQEYASNTSQTMSPAVETQMHKTVQKVTKDIEAFRYNTAIATIMEYTNLLSAAVKDGKASKEALQTLVQLIAPFAPHMAEEVWREIFAEETSVHISPWPTFDPEKTVDSQIVIPVQVNGKLRAQLTIDADNTNEEEIVRFARELDQIQKWVTSEPRKVIYIQGKLLNFVV